MANSFGSPVGQPGGRVLHKQSGSTITVRSDAKGMLHILEEAGLKAQYRVAYYVGAGIVGRSYLVRVGDYLLQSPVSYYSRTNRWDLTPGYESEHTLDFDHQIVSGCLFCHAGRVALVGSSVNRYQDVPFTSISCGRCHGPGAAHIKSPSANNIVNPAKLEPRARDSICEQCHLEGSVRVLNPGKDWWDFQAGQELEKTFSVYFEDDPKGPKAVSQPEQLAASKCARMSESRLWCGTCHSVHGDPPSDRKQQVKTICVSCHAALSPAAHPQPVADCLGCHMPPRNAINVAHAAVTDHRLLARPDSETPSPQKQTGPQAAPTVWRNPAPPLDRRNLGLACLQVAEDHHSLPLARQAVELLAALPPQMLEDPKVLSVLGSVFLEEHRPADALRLFTAAAREQPDNASDALEVATASEAAGNIGRAIKLYEQAIRLDPSFARAYFKLADLYASVGQEGARVNVLRRYLSLFPESIKGRLQLSQGSSSFTAP